MASIAAYLGTRFCYLRFLSNSPLFDGHSPGGLQLEICVVVAQTILFGLAAALEGMLGTRAKSPKKETLSRRVLLTVILLDMLRYWFLSRISVPSLTAATAPALPAAALAVAMTMSSLTLRRQDDKPTRALMVAVLAAVIAVQWGQGGAVAAAAGAFSVTGLCLLGQEVLLRYKHQSVFAVAFLTSLSQLLVVASLCGPPASLASLLPSIPGALQAAATYTALCCALRFTLLSAVKAMSTVSVLAADLLFLACSCALLFPSSLASPSVVLRLASVFVLFVAILRHDVSVAERLELHRIADEVQPKGRRRSAAEGAVAQGTVTAAAAEPPPGGQSITIGGRRVVSRLIKSYDDQVELEKQRTQDEFDRKVAQITGNISSFAISQEELDRKAAEILANIARSKADDAASQAEGYDGVAPAEVAD